jgi:hypothetical protein
VRQQITEAAHVEIRSADWAIAEMIGLNERASERSEAPYCRWRTSGQQQLLP